MNPPVQRSLHDYDLLDDYEAALRDLLYYYDKVRGVAGHGEGWTAADVLRLEQIRALSADLSWFKAGLPNLTEQNSNSRALEAHSRPNGSGKPPKPRKAPSKLRASRKPRQRRPLA